MSLQKEFLERFTLSILINSRPKVNVKREVINSDMIPHVSEELFKQKSLIEKTIPAPLEFKQAIQLRPQTNSVPLVNLIPKNLPVSHLLQAKHPSLPEKKPEPKYTLPSSNIPPSFGEYGKITALIKDPAVTLVQCDGAGQNIIIARAGQRQFTKITLNPLEIKEILDKVAEKAKIPLLEGVFKAAVENFTINAVVSSVVGSRFIIKKQTPYSLIEPQ